MTAVIAAPRNPRHTYWAKLIDSSMALPRADAVIALPDLPGPYLTRGPVDLKPMDVLIHAERTAKGWVYGVTFARGGVAVTLHPSREFVEGLAACGQRPPTRTTDISNCLAVAQAIRQGVLS